MKLLLSSRTLEQRCLDVTFLWSFDIVARSCDRSKPIKSVDTTSFWTFCFGNVCRTDSLLCASFYTLILLSKKKLQSWTESMNEMGNFRQILKTTSNWKAILEKVLRASDLLESLELYDLRS